MGALRTTSVTDGIVKALVRGWEAETLFAVRDRLEELQHHQGYDDLRSLIEDSIENAQDRLIRYPVLEQAEYAKALGFLSGLKMLLEIPTAVRSAAISREKAIETAEDSAEERTS
jgi:hypothetical protein